MPGSYRGEGTDNHMRKDVLQKGNISGGLPWDRWPGLVAKTRPINGNRSEVVSELFLERAHFSPSRN